MSINQTPMNIGGGMKEYTDPTIETLGTVSELTALIDKCGGSADSAFPTLLEERFAEDCDA
jgi:hypothetical protein